MIEKIALIDIKSKSACFSCVSDEYLSSTIKEHKIIKQCSYCGNSAECFSIRMLSDEIDKAFKSFFEKIPVPLDDYNDDLMGEANEDLEDLFDLMEDSIPVLSAISSAAGIEESIAQDVLSVLCDKYKAKHVGRINDMQQEFALNSKYKRVPIDDAPLQERWNEFEFSIKNRNRFFNMDAMKFLKYMFRDIDGFNTFDGNSIVKTVGPNDCISSAFRARMVADVDSLRVVLSDLPRELGPPPPNKTPDGRMNARGISIFYGALDEDTAIREVRPPVGIFIIVGRFNIIRRLRVLDLSSIGSINTAGSIFDSTHKFRMERAEFFKFLSTRLNQPVLPGREGIDYLTMQAVADFLSSELHPALDGILFPSLQTLNEAGGGSNSLNIALFNHASLVQTEDRAHSQQVTVRVNVDDSKKFSEKYKFSMILSKYKDPKTGSLAEGISTNLVDFELRKSKFDSPISLDLIQQSVKVHIVNGISVSTVPHNISRHTRTT